jgi:predicted nucleic acid-binding protein
MSEIFILDSSILIDDLRTGCHSSRIASLAGPLRLSSVVMAELWRGAISKFDREFLTQLARKRPLLTPTEKDWIVSGQVLGEIRRDKGYEARKLRELHFDVLIALTARTHGAKVITSNKADFELIWEFREFELEVW